MGRPCACYAKPHRACPICCGLTLCSHPPMRRPDNLRRRGKRPRRCCGSSPVSQLQHTNVSSSSRPPRLSTTVLTECARRDCRRVEPLAEVPNVLAALPLGRATRCLLWVTEAAVPGLREGARLAYIGELRPAFAAGLGVDAACSRD